MERAWIDHVLGLDRPVFALARIRRATVLLDREGMKNLFEKGAETRARPIDSLRGRGGSLRSRTEAAAVRLASSRWRGIPDSKELSRALGAEPRYLATGHAGLDARCIGAISGLPGARTAVLVHDTIPLDLPETQKAGAADRFRLKLGWVARAADLVIAPARATALDIERHLSAMGSRATTVVSRPGVTVSAPGPVPRAVPAGRPFFVALGTIEPRKNHALLLDLWEKPAALPGAPMLVIAGRRGWRNDAVFRRLDALAGGGDVVELNDLDDTAVAGLLKSANALLFPSFAEGFGYPPLEAACLGTQVVASPLPQTRELLGDTVIYAAPGELYQWRQAIEGLAGPRAEKDVPPLPTWRDHFNMVLNSLG